MKSTPKHPGVDKGVSQGTDRLMEQVVSRPNMLKAYYRVYGNGGSGGIDGMSVDDLKGHLSENWEAIKTALLADDYYPQGVRSVMIPKPSGGERQLGIPTVMDRLIQQAVAQVLDPIYDPSFSDHSYGFRLGHSAHQAVIKARDYINEGRGWVVDVDLAKFFDEVPHERLISKLRKGIGDKRVIHLIDRYLKAGMFRDGLMEVRSKGTPQGSPLSPLLSNIVLDELDKELERRGLRFVRYADDFQIYVGSQRSGDRVMASISKFISVKLRLRVNEEKSLVALPWQRTLLGYSFTRKGRIKLKPADGSIKRFKAKVKERMRRGRGKNLEKFIHFDLNDLLRGWINYFSLSQTRRFAKDLDGWIRRHLRKIIWRQWKRKWTRKKGLEARGLDENNAIRTAFNGFGAWRNSYMRSMREAFPPKYFEQLGLVSLLDKLDRKQAKRQTLGTAVIRNRTSGGVRGSR